MNSDTRFFVNSKKINICFIHKMLGLKYIDDKNNIARNRELDDDQLNPVISSNRSFPPTNSVITLTYLILSLFARCNSSSKRVIRFLKRATSRYSCFVD